MDSSNSDSFGSFGVSGGAGGASGSGVIASGSDSGAAMPTGVPVGISSGGPVAIGGGMQEKKGKKWIAAVVLFVVFAVALVGGYFLVSYLLPRQDNGDVVVDKGNSKIEFNRYANYILYGKDSDADINYDDANLVAYFSKISGEALVEYVENANAKFWSFDKVYYDNSGKEDLGYLKAYFQDFASINPLSEKDIIEKYALGGRTLVERTIAERYVLDGADANLAEYLAAEEELAELRLEILVNAEATGCLRDGDLVADCYGLTSDEGEELMSLVLKTREYSSIISSKAWITFGNVYDEVYGVNKDGENSI